MKSVVLQEVDPNRGPQGLQEDQQDHQVPWASAYVMVRPLVLHLRLHSLPFPTVEVPLVLVVVQVDHQEPLKEGDLDHVDPQLLPVQEEVNQVALVEALHVGVVKVWVEQHAPKQAVVVHQVVRERPL